MGAKTRQLAIAGTAVVLVLVGTVGWTVAHSDSTVEQQTIGLDEVKLACFDVRQASDDFHSAAHTGDSELMQSARQASLDLCRDVPEPVFPGQPAS